MEGIRLLLLGLSTIGTWEIVRHRIRIHAGFLPSVVVAFQALLLILAGILNVLAEMAVLLWAAGLAGLALYTVTEKGKNLKYYLRPEFLFLGLGMVIVLFCVQGKNFTHYDNFSHWALVVKKMLRVNRFPSFDMTGITYRGYPMGSTAYVYFVSKIAGGGETVQMLAQSYMTLTCIPPLFSLCKRNRWQTFFLVLLASNFFLSFNIQVTELLVDTLLPLAGMSALLFVHDGRKRTREAAPVVVLYLIWVLQIKNSGVYFALMICILYLYYARKNRQLLFGAGCCAVAFLSLLIWNRHCSYVYPSADFSKHSLDASWWETAFQDKSLEDVKHIILELFRYAFQWSRLWIPIAFAAAVCICSVLAAKGNRSASGKAALAAAGMYLTYQLGLLLVYVFSMTRTEAFELASIERYEKTILIAIFYLITALGVKTLSAERLTGILSAGLAVLMGFAFWAQLAQTGSPLSVADYQPYRIGKYNGLEVRDWMEALKEEYQLPEDGDYAIVIEEWDSTYFYFMGMYLFPDSDIVIYTDAAAEDVDSIHAKYVLIHDEVNPEVRRWIRANYPEQEGHALIICR